MPDSDNPPAPNSYNDGSSSPYQGGSPPYLPFNNPERSVNDGRPDTYSDPAAKGKSQGHRSILCGAIGVLNRFTAWSNQLSPEQARTLIGVGIISGAIIVTGGAAIPMIIAGAAIGGMIGYGIQAYRNYQQGGLSVMQALDPRRANWSLVEQAAFQGAVSGAVAGVVSYFLPVSGSMGLGSRVAATAGVEFGSGRAEQIGVNLVSGQRWNEDLWEPEEGSWWGAVALDVLPGVGATLLKPAWKGVRGGISGAADRWRLTKRLDDFATRGTPINPLNKFKAKMAPYQALASQVARGTPGAPGCLISILRGADRAGWKAFRQAGMQPDYITRLNRFTQAGDLEMGIRTSPRMSLFWRIFGLPAKTIDVKAKTRFGIVQGPDGVWYRSDMDLAYIRSRETGELLSDLKIQKLLDTLNEVAVGKSAVSRPEFMHPTHWTFDTPGKIGHPGSLFVLNAGVDSGLIPKHQVRTFTENRGLQWYWDSPRKFYDTQGRLTTGKYTVSGEKMAPHLTGSTTSGKSQFLFRNDAHTAVLDAAHHADAYNLWENNKAKVFVQQNGPAGILGRSGELTDWINVYRTNKGIIHGSPGSPP